MPRTRKDDEEATVTKHVGLDVHKETIAVAVASDGEDREVRFHGTIANTPEAVRRLASRLAGPGTALSLCYEAGPVRLRSAPAARRAGACLPGDRALDDAAPARRAGEDRPTRRHDVGAPPARG